MSDVISMTDIEAARDRIAGYAVKTPLLRFPVLDELTGGTILVKAECLQRTGSFKFRGAFNRLSQIPMEDRAKGVVACSSGNHAQGVAEAARLLGMKATIVMPADAPQIKLDRTRAFGAAVVTYDRYNEDREAIAAELCKESGATFVHPFNDLGVIAGQGTAGLELAAQAKELGFEKLDAAIVCTGGGGLASGVAYALCDAFPDLAFHTVEPEGFDDYARSLVAGSRLGNDKPEPSVMDAILTEMPGEHSFSILKSRAKQGLTVSDAEALNAIAFAFQELKLVAEPGGAAALAAVLSGKIDLKGRVVAITITGGNVDIGTLTRALAM